MVGCSPEREGESFSYYEIQSGQHFDPLGIFRIASEIVDAPAEGKSVSELKEVETHFLFNQEQGVIAALTQRFPGKIVTIDQFYKNPTYNAIEGIKEDPVVFIPPPYRRIAIKDKKIAKILCDELNVEAVGELWFSFKRYRYRNPFQWPFSGDREKVRVFVGLTLVNSNGEIVFDQYLTRVSQDVDYEPNTNRFNLSGKNREVIEKTVSELQTDVVAMLKKIEMK
ncbi:MAG: hypothetical protein AB7F28_02865 [Candidatus Margulisiibacteriota bacterium]